MEHLDNSALLVLHEYNEYANNLVLDAAGKLREADLTCISSPSHGTVLGLLFHLLGTETHFLQACLGKELESQVDDLKMPSLCQIREKLSEVSCKRAGYLKRATDAEILQPVEVLIGGKLLTLPRWQLITQSLLHSAHHRGELSIVMTNLGRPLPTLDVIIQFVQNSGQEWPFKIPQTQK
jgi:uncharacterized damage-inducible protein DinB